MDNQYEDIKDAIEELIEDNTIPNNVRAKLGIIAKKLVIESDDPAIKINRILDELEEITNDSNIPSYARTDIMNIASMLEMLS